MMPIELLSPEEIDVAFEYPEGILRVVRQGIGDMTPWHMMDHEQAARRLNGLRGRYKEKYIPFAYRQDNDDIACFDPGNARPVVVVHDFASDGFERRKEYVSFWSWFRDAVDDMISFE